MGFGDTLFSAENQAHRRILASLHPMFAGVVEVQVHLTCVGIAELAGLEINDDKAFQTALEEEEIDSEP